MKTHDIAERSRQMRDLRRPDPDSFLRITLPVEEAREAREFLREYPAGGYITFVENWSQLSDETIQLTMRRSPTTD